MDLKDMGLKDLIRQAGKVYGKGESKGERVILLPESDGYSSVYLIRKDEETKDEEVLSYINIFYFVKYVGLLSCEIKEYGSIWITSPTGTLGLQIKKDVATIRSI